MLFPNALITLLCLLGKIIVTHSEAPASKYKKILKPCFADDHLDKNDNDDPEHCTADSCPKENFKEANKIQEIEDESFKLVRLEGVKKGFEREVNLGEGRKYRMITRAMKPLMFEIPNFLSDDECDKIIRMAKQFGLSTSIAGFDMEAYEGDLENELQRVGDQKDWQNINEKHRFARSFVSWDKNNDDVIHLDEIKQFAKKYFLLFLTDEDMREMFKKLDFSGFDKTDAIDWQAFRKLNVKAMLKYFDFIKKKHPRHRPRFSEQAWLEQNKKASHFLQSLQQRVKRLTRLPQKIISGSESLQAENILTNILSFGNIGDMEFPFLKLLWYRRVSKVVRYTKHGHYHAHLDSNPSNRTDIPCCHQIFRPKGEHECRVCRFATVLYYLNDVEEGGETAFIVADNETYSSEVLSNPNNPTDDFNLSVNCHKAKLVVKPKKGSAILWYNHHIDPDSGLLGSLDPYSLHGGCDIIRGEKWVANNWITAPFKEKAHLNSVYDITE